MDGKGCNDCRFAGSAINCSSCYDQLLGLIEDLKNELKEAEKFKKIADKKRERDD